MNWLIFYWDQSNCMIFKNDHHGMMKNQKLRQWCSIIFHFLDHHVVHILHRRSRFPILYYFQQYRAWMVRRSIQDECYFLFVVLASFHSHNLHIRPKSPIRLMIWHHFEYFPGRIVMKDVKQEAVLTSCLQNCMPCCICDPCIIISFTLLIFLQKPYTFVIFDNF